MAASKKTARGRKQDRARVAGGQRYEEGTSRSRERGRMVCELLIGTTAAKRVLQRKLSCGQLDCLALLVFSIEDFNLEIWETRL
jgi:hypothetical protein